MFLHLLCDLFVLVSYARLSSSYFTLSMLISIYVFLIIILKDFPVTWHMFFQLPAPQLENALSKNPTLKTPLAEHAEQPNIRSTLPRCSLFTLICSKRYRSNMKCWICDVFPIFCRSTLVVLGLAEDQPQQPAVTQVQSSQNQAAETSSSAADTATEVTQESSGAS